MGHYREIDGCGRFMKYSLFLVNFIIFIVGITITGLTIAVLSGKIKQISVLTDISLLNGSVYILLVGGIITSIISFFGCLGAAKEVKCFLFMYSIIIFLLFVIVLVGGILVYAFREKFGNTLETQMKNSMSLRDNEGISTTWNFLQSSFHCCGVNGVADWGSNIPLSCCEKSNELQARCLSNNAYDKGCIIKISEVLRKHADTLGISGIIVAIFMLIGMIFSYTIYNIPLKKIQNL